MPPYATVDRHEEIPQGSQSLKQNGLRTQVDITTCMRIQHVLVNTEHVIHLSNLFIGGIDLGVGLKVV
jgi:hypothetical protein